MHIDRVYVTILFAQQTDGTPHVSSTLPNALDHIIQQRLNIAYASLCILSGHVAKHIYNSWRAEFDIRGGLIEGVQCRNKRM